MTNKFNNPLRIFGWSIVLITFAFILNNVLNFWYDFPGVDKLFASYNIFFETHIIRIFGVFFKIAFLLSDLDQMTYHCRKS